VADVLEASRISKSFINYYKNKRHYSKPQERSRFCNGFIQYKRKLRTRSCL